MSRVDKKTIPLKSVKMTDKKKQKIQQRKLVVEEEQKQKREQLLYIFLKVKTSREVALYRKNTLKLDDRWRQIMRGVRSEDILRQLLLVRETFDDKLATRGTQVEMLTQDFFLLDEQFNIAFSAHINFLRNLHDTHHANIREEQARFHAVLRQMKLHHTARLSRLTDRQQMSGGRLDDIWHAARVSGQQQHAALTSRHQALLVNVKSRNREEISLATQKMEDEIVTKLKEHKRILDQFYESTTQQQLTYSRLFKLEQKYQNSMANYEKNIRSLKNKIMVLDQQLSTELGQHEAEISLLAVTRDTLLARACRQKNRYERQTRLYSSSVKKLAIISEEQLEEMDSKHRLMKKLVDLWQICSRFEWPEDSIWRSHVQLTEFRSESSTLLNNTKSNDVLRINEEMQLMERFWLRYGTVAASSKRVLLERTEIERENAGLRRVLESYLRELHAPTAAAELQSTSSVQVLPVSPAERDINDSKRPALVTQTLHCSALS